MLTKVVIVVLAVGVPLGLFTAFLIGVLRKRRAQARALSLLVSGQSAPATILGVRDGSWTSRGGRAFFKDVKLDLEVRPPQGDAFHAIGTAYEVLASSSVRPGQALLVKYDPNDTSAVAVDEGSFREAALDGGLEELLAEERREEASRAERDQQGRPHSTS